LRQAQGTITVQTRRQGNSDISRQVAQWVDRQGVQTGLLTVFLQHVSAHLSLQEHSDRDDLYTFFSRMERDPAGFGEFTSAVTSVSLTIPVAEGRMALGARQRLFLYEHRETPQSRKLVLHLVGD
jgi:secondary thiamine-phosphate synthase enzyme